MSTSTANAPSPDRPARLRVGRPPRENAVAIAVRRSLGLHRFFTEPIDSAAAAAEIEQRLRYRDEQFLDSMRRLVFDLPTSPYRPLLDAADCAYADVEASVRAHGIEATLERLRDAGVYVTVDEWKGREPIVRTGVELHVQPGDFDNPLQVRAVEGSSSGSSGRAATVPYGWAGLVDTAYDFRAAYDAHGLGDVPCAIWMPAPPGGAGLLTAIICAKIGSPPERWFSQTPARGSAVDRLMLHVLLAGSRLSGRALPRPRHTELADADVVARWLGAGEPPRYLSGFASSAIRVAQVAQERGIDISGRAFVVGGEPVTPERKAFIRSLGARVVAIYVASDCGLVATGCPKGVDEEDYHVHVDRIALVPGAGAAAGEAAPLLLSSLRLASAKVLVNVDIGDQGVLERRSCDCVFGRRGLDLRLTHVQSRAAQTSEGMTVSSRVLWEYAGAALAPAGAGRDDYQIWEVRGTDGLSCVRLAVSPHLQIDEQEVVERILRDLAARDAGGKVAAEVWRQAGTLTVIRERPRLSAGGKLLPVLSLDAETP